MIQPSCQLNGLSVTQNKLCREETVLFEEFDMPKCISVWPNFSGLLGLEASSLVSFLSKKQNGPHVFTIESSFPYITP